MRPELFHIGPIPIYSFGLMMALAFLSANYLLTKEITRQWRDEERAAAFASVITLIALVAGVIGSKLFHLIENPGLVLQNGLSEVFSGSGLTFFGGLLLAIFVIFLYCRKKKISFVWLADVTAPGLILAYGIGRIGCQLAGDGDYGIPYEGTFAMSYPHGTVPTIAGYNPELKNKWLEMHPGMSISDTFDITVHPTPVYETLACFAIFAFLFYLQRRAHLPTGRLFAIYLIFAGLERFLVEWLRLNPLYLGLSQAQWIGIALMIAGTWLFMKKSAPTTQAAAKPAS